VVANGIASKLAGLFQSADPQNQIQGQSYLDFFGSIATRAGERSSSAADGKARARTMLAQAQELRSAESGVSLDEEATRLVALQRSYQAAAKIVSIVDDLAATAVNLIR
jgi:flagellar hook-associated protein 1 FlgK